LSGKLLDPATAAQLFQLFTVAKDDGLALDIHFDPLRDAERAWIVQLWDPEEREITTSRAPTLAQAVASALERVRAKEAVGGDW
jgi:hypothetical protein